MVILVRRGTGELPIQSKLAATCIRGQPVSYCKADAQYTLSTMEQGACSNHMQGILLEVDMVSALIRATSMIALSVMLKNVLAVDFSICNPGSKVTYYQSGAIASCVLKDYYTMNRIRCNKLGPVNFYEDGNLQSCVLADYFDVNGVTCNQLGPISFYDDRNVNECILKQPGMVNGVRCNLFGPISFYQNGKLKSCVTPTAGR